MRRFLIIAGVITTIFAGVGLLSYAWQFGFVGSWQSIGMRKGILTFVWRNTPITDGMGFLVDDVTAVNRAMYHISGGTEWRQDFIWPWVFGILATVAYSLILPPIRGYWKRLAPNWLIRVLTTACIVIAALWTTSHLVMVTFDNSKLHFRLTDGEAVMYVDRLQADIGLPWGTGWNVYRGFPPLLIHFPAYVRFNNTTILLKVPLGILLVVLGVATIVLARPDRRSWPGYCRRCAYDLTGNESGVCPECGSIAKTNKRAPDTIPS